MANESKKFALFACCMMTMQALRLVISTAGFCVVRFHIDCELFNIFISRLVNAVLMSQLFGNWLGDLIVFAASGQIKLYAIAAANWAELICFCSAFYCFCHTECGHLTGFYWSMVSSYFWWKVGEAPCISIGGDKVDWYFAGFTLSGVWAACLKGVVMMCIGKEEKGIHSDVLGDVNVTVVGTVSVVGARSVKTTVDYRAAKWLFLVVIVVTTLMCLHWDLVAITVTNDVRDGATGPLAKAVKTVKDGGEGDNILAKKIRELGTNVQTKSRTQAVTLTDATLKEGDISVKGEPNQIEIVVRNVTCNGNGALQPPGDTELQKKVKEALGKGQDKITTVTGHVAGTEPNNKTLTLTVTTAEKDRDKVLTALKATATTFFAETNNNKLLTKIKGLTSKKVNVQPSGAEAKLDFDGATVGSKDVTTGSPPGDEDKIKITLEKVKQSAGTTGSGQIQSSGAETQATANAVKGILGGLVGFGKIATVKLDGQVQTNPATFDLTITVTVNSSTHRDSVLGEIQTLANTPDVTDSNNKILAAIQKLAGIQTVDVKDGSGSMSEAQLNFSTAKVDGNGVTPVSGDEAATISFVVKKGSVTGSTTEITMGPNTAKLQGDVKDKLEDLAGKGTIDLVMLGGKTDATGTNFELTVTVTVNAAGRILNVTEVRSVAVWSGVVVAGIMAVPGAVLFGWIGGRRKWCAAVGGVVAVLITRGLYGIVVADVTAGEEWLVWYKWGKGDWNKPAERLAALIGLGVGTAAGALLGLCIGACKGSKKRGFLGGAFIGGFVGLWSGEIYNGKATWNMSTGNVGEDGAAKGREWAVVSCGFFIVVCGLGTVYSIYPGMAPCSITQFQYFNIIDIWILILSSIGPIVIMVVDLAEMPERLGWTIFMGKTKDWKKDGEAWLRMWSAIVVAVVMTKATLICEIITINVMQHPFSKMAQQVKNSGWRACTLTILMVSFQLTSTGIGFGCVAAGSGFNDGVYNALSTVTLWTTECCGVLGEGYLTELKKYEPGKWPTQGMGKWATYWWWNRKAFGNAWAIWCCIGTTDLRRDIMLCRK